MKHTVTLIGDERKLAKESKTAFYKHSTVLGMENGESSCIEIECTKRRIKDDKPIALAVAILQYSKLLFLRFVYDVLFRYLEKESFRLNYADTDSLCISKLNSHYYLLIRFFIRIKFVRFHQDRSSYKQHPKRPNGSDNFTAGKAASAGRIQTELA